MEEKKNVQNNNVKEKKEKKEKNVKTKKSKKKIIIAVIIVVVILALIAAFILYHYSQLRTLTDEINKVSSIEFVNEDGSIKQDASIDMNIKTKGKYAIVEKTLKDYTNEVVVETQKLSDAFNEEEIVKLASIENIEEDGPDFVNSKEKITELREAVNSYVEKMDEFADENYIYTRIDDKDVSDYYKELYRNLATDKETNASLEQSIEELKSAQEEAVSVLDGLESIFDFLSENKDEWDVEEGQIVFTTDSAYEEYTNLVSALKIM